MCVYMSMKRSYVTIHILLCINMYMIKHALNPLHSTTYMSMKHAQELISLDYIHTWTWYQFILHVSTVKVILCSYGNWNDWRSLPFSHRNSQTFTYIFWYWYNQWWQYIGTIVSTDILFIIHIMHIYIVGSDLIIDCYFCIRQLRSLCLLSILNASFRA